MMTPEKFKTAYDKAETLGEMQSLLDKVDGAQMQVIVDAMEITKSYFGLDMREGVYLTCMKHEIEFRKTQAAKKEVA